MRVDRVSILIRRAFDSGEVLIVTCPAAAEPRGANCTDLIAELPVAHEVFRGTNHFFSSHFFRFPFFFPFGCFCTSFLGFADD